MATRSPAHSGGAAPHNDMPAVVRHWIFRLIIDHGMEHALVRSTGFRSEELARSIGLGRFVDEDSPYPVNLPAVRKALRQLQREVNTLPRELPPTLAANVQRIAELVGLNPTECQLLAFALLMHGHGPLRELCSQAGPMRPRHMAHTLATLLDLSQTEVLAALRPQAPLIRSGLLNLNRNIPNSTLDDRLELLNEALPERLSEAVVEPTEWLRDMVRPGMPGLLSWDDYTHLDKQLDVLRPYLRHALTEGRQGVNIFMYGPPGTGKTELARLLAQDMGCELYEVTTEEEDNDPIDGRQRIKAHCAANSFFAQRRALVLFDEVEEVLIDGVKLQMMRHMLGSSNYQHRYKGWINRILETNPLPTLWVSNSANGLDPAFARRFDMVVHMPVPPRKHRERMLRATGGGLLTEQAVTQLSEATNLAPAVVTRAVGVVQTVTSDISAQPSDAVHMLINSTLRAQGHPTMHRHKPDVLPGHYRPDFINADTDLGEVARLLTTARTGRLCLYGPPGTGKTAYGHWLAQQMSVPLHVRRASDLLDKYLGESEKNIAQAFAEAEADGGVLLIDEVDSFLQDRRGAERQWEVSQVNEMLTQMEAFSGVFVASTNLMDQLDPAVLRRFDLKVRFNPLRTEQATELLQHHCRQHGLPAPNATDLQRLHALTQLTPGDYAAVQRQSRLRPLHSASAWVAALEAECSLKPKTGGGGMGFV
jgi:SpoVK/Ycf46/Vps4 family AAA+-type ATPase